MAGVWLCQHLWEHYAFGGDKKYLSKTAYPLMKGAAEFLLQWLQKDPETGYWITNPSTSPENRFRYIDKEGKKQNGEISRSSGMDLGLAWDLLTNCIEASTVLDTDKAFRQQCMDVRANLQPFRLLFPHRRGMGIYSHYQRVLWIQRSGYSAQTCFILCTIITQRHFERG